MTARDELRAKVRAALEDHMGTVEQATDAVMRLFPVVLRDRDEVETTTMADLPDRTAIVTTWLVGRCPVESESYRQPGGNWRSLP